MLCCGDALVERGAQVANSRRVGADPFQADRLIEVRRQDVGAVPHLADQPAGAFAGCESVPPRLLVLAPPDKRLWQGGRSPRSGSIR